MPSKNRYLLLVFNQLPTRLMRSFSCVLESTEFLEKILRPIDLSGFLKSAKI